MSDLEGMDERSGKASGALQSLHHKLLKANFRRLEVFIHTLALASGCGCSNATFLSNFKQTSEFFY